MRKQFSQCDVLDQPVLKTNICASLPLNNGKQISAILANLSSDCKLQMPTQEHTDRGLDTAGYSGSLHDMKAFSEVSAQYGL